MQPWQNMFVGVVSGDTMSGLLLDQREEDIIRILMCPVCTGQICADDASPNCLVCLHCGERYTVIDGIPVMIPEKVRLVNLETVQLYSSQPVRIEENEPPAYVRAQVAYIKEKVDLDNKVVIDFGGAEGMLIQYLVGTKKVVVADISLPRLRQGASKGIAETTFVCGDIQTPFLRLQADVILLMSVLEHVLSPQDVLRNIVRLLKLGGALILVVPVCNLPFKEFATWAFRKIKGMDIAKVRREHLRVYSTSSVIAQILEAGLTVENVKHISVLGELGAPKQLIEFWSRLGVLDRLLASGVYLLARKL